MRHFLPFSMVPPRAIARAAVAAMGLSGLLISCGNVDSAQGQSPTQSLPVSQAMQGQPVAESQGESQDATSDQIPDGQYVMGGTSQGLEVSGDQYRYYSEGGEEEWQPIADLTLIQAGVIFDGRNYWCINTPTEPGVCTEQGWRTIAERLAEQETEEAEPGLEPGWDAEAYPVTVAPSELAVGGFRSGDQLPSVLQQLGQPQRTTQEYYTRYEFPGLTLWFDQDYLVDIKSTSADYCTPSGVCPGMTAEAVRQIYGTPRMSDSEDGRFMEYSVDGETCWLEIGLERQQVSSVGVACMI